MFFVLVQLPGVKKLLIASPSPSVFGFVYLKKTKIDVGATTLRTISSIDPTLNVAHGNDVASPTMNANTGNKANI
jgi:hypothetical protein